MDDESGWHAILVDGWGPLVCAAVVERVVTVFAFRKGVLAVTASNPDDAPAEWVEAVHVAVVDGIKVETGADIEELGSQAAWVPYEEVWQALDGRMMRDETLVAVPEDRVGQVLAIMQELPRDAVVHAGGVPWPEEAGEPVVIDGRTRVHLDGVFRWLASDDSTSDADRALARALVAVVRDDPLGGLL